MSTGTGRDLLPPLPRELTTAPASLEAPGRMAPAPAPRMGSRTRRLRSIDVARGASVLLMIAAHAANALLGDGYRTGWLWHQVNILFGFVAPAFLLFSGIALAISLDRPDPPGARRPAHREAVRRAGWLLFIGYWLQIPVLSIRQLVYCHRPEELARLFDVNILQTIALSSLLIICIVRLVAAPERAGAVALGLALAIALAAPLIWRSDLHAVLLAPVGRALAPQPVTTFPLVPYVVYALVGFGAARWLRRSGKRPMAAPTIAAAGLIAMIAGRVVPPIPPHDDLWGSSIHHVLYRLGGVLLLLGAGLALARHLRPRTTWIEWIGRRSLGFYILHLMVIYGSPVNAGLRTLLGAAHPPFVVAAIAAGTVAACALVLLAWERLEAARPVIATRCMWIGWGIFWALFLTIP